MIWAAAASLTWNRRCAQAVVSAAPNIAEPTALAQKIRDPSALHNQAGQALVASAARRGLRNKANSDSTVGMRDGTRLLNEFLIVPGVCGVHGGGCHAAKQGRITLIA
jgi:hypothetical protein